MRYDLSSAKVAPRSLRLSAWFWAVVTLGVSAATALAAMASAAEPVLFNRDIRPILADRCFVCHGPDSSSREAELRLDQRAAAIADRGGYQAIAPGAPDDSELIARVDSSEEGMQMPPAEVGKPLTDRQRQLLRDWIAQGAKWQPHWSRTPIVRPEVPSRPGIVAPNPIDHFIQARLHDEGLAPSPAADRRTLIRRLTFDLTGLPPTPDAVDRFVADQSPTAYGELVDRLLASPHYGERMAMYWLDLVRYADTLGYHGDQPRSVSPYRDYVIRAFNHNEPFDRFTIENLAGDLLPNASLEQKVASTYNRLNRASAEGGVQPKEYLAKYAADRVRTTATVWLASTLGCAECHDHKFDPFTTKDFYSFEAFFADIKEQGIVPGAKHIEQLPVPTPEQQTQLAKLKLQIDDAQTKLVAHTAERETLFRQWLANLKTTQGIWRPAVPTAARSAGGATLDVAADGTVTANDKSPAKDTYTIELAPGGNDVTAIHLEVLPDAALPEHGPGRASNGNFVLEQFRIQVNGREVGWRQAIASHSQSGFPVSNLAGNSKKGWAILPKTGAAIHAVFIPKTRIPSAGGGAADAKEPSRLVLTMVQNYGTQHTLGRFRIWLTSDPSVTATAKTIDDVLVPEPLVAMARVAATELTAAQHDTLWQYFIDHAPALASARKTLADVKARRDTIQRSVITTLASAAGPPRVMRVLPRGNWMDDSGEIVQPAVPAFLGRVEAGDRRLTRLDLARWLTGRDNPLTARTLVNRLWMLFLGEGLARSVSDFGSQGQWPTHPALLDWMAAEILDSGWDVKHMVRLIVTSATYQQSSTARPELRARDPLNRLFARQGSWRLEAEMVRDNALSVAGLLVPQIGGPSVKPYQPAGYWAQLNFPKRVYQQDTGAKQYRRGLYTHWQRTFLHPSLLAFDAPTREECTARRDRSNTPLQALVLLNDPTYVEAARVLAAKIVRRSDAAVDDRLNWAFRTVLARAPTASELQILAGLLQRSTQRFRSDPKAAQQEVSVGLAPPPEDLDPVAVASWTAVARALLNLHETITRY